MTNPTGGGRTDPVLQVEGDDLFLQVEAHPALQVEGAG